MIYITYENTQIHDRLNHITRNDAICSTVSNWNYDSGGVGVKIWTFKSGSKLVPCTSEDKEKIGKLPKGEPFMIKYVEIRNVAHHRKYFAFINTVFKNLPEKFDKNWADVDSFRRSIQMYAGYYDETISLKGETHLQPKSIAFDKLDETAFSELHTKVKNVIGKHILPEMDIEIVEKEIESYY